MQASCKHCFSYLALRHAFCSKHKDHCSTPQQVKTLHVTYYSLFFPRFLLLRQIVELVAVWQGFVSNFSIAIVYNALDFIKHLPFRSDILHRRHFVQKRWRKLKPSQTWFRRCRTCAQAHSGLHKPRPPPLRRDYLRLWLEHNLEWRANDRLRSSVMRREKQILLFIFIWRTKYIKYLFSQCNNIYISVHSCLVLPWLLVLAFFVWFDHVKKKKVTRNCCLFFYCSFL